MDDAAQLIDWRQKLAEARQSRIEVMETVERVLKEVRVAHAPAKILAEGDHREDEFAEHRMEADSIALARAEPRFEVAEPRFEFVLRRHGRSLFHLTIGVKAFRVTLTRWSTVEARLR